MSDDTIWSLVTSQLFQVTIVVLVVSPIAAVAMKTRPHLAHVLLLSVLIKCLTPPVIPGPWIGWRAASVWPTPSAAAQHARHADTAPTRAGNATASSARSSDAPWHRVRTADRRWLTPAAGQRMLLIVWLAGVLTKLVFTVRQWLLARRLWLSQKDACEPALQRRCQRLASRLGIQRPVQVVVDKAQFGPLVTGWRRPVIVLPKCLLHRPRTLEIDLALAHELVHVRRGDTFTGGLQALVRSIWWFHPFVAWMNRLLDRACEQCCDDEVIATLRCEPAQYARCLVNILAQRQTLRHVTLVPGTRPVGITASRLARLGRPAHAFLQRAPWYYWLLFVIFTFVLVPARPLRSAPQQAKDPRTLSEARLVTAEGSEDDPALRAFQAGEWDKAVRAYQKTVAADATDAVAWYRLGYALHASGRMEEAIEAHTKAAEFPRTRSVSLYNLACAHCRLGESEQALMALERAIEHGFRADESTIQGDADLADLQEHPKFKELIQRAGATMGVGPYRQLDFMVGTWQVHHADGTLLGRSVITRDERGYLLTEKWEATNGSTGTGMSYYDPKAAAWRQTFVGMFGNIIHMQGNLEHGALRMHGETVFANGVTALSKSLTTPRDDGEFQFVLEESRDDGQTWKTVFDGRYGGSP